MESLSPITSPEEEVRGAPTVRRKAMEGPPTSWKTGEEKRGKKSMTTFNKRPVYEAVKSSEMLKEKFRMYLSMTPFEYIV
jgi:hypothetical protein